MIGWTPRNHLGIIFKNGSKNNSFKNHYHFCKSFFSYWCTKVTRVYKHESRMQ
jgi:hypothetical protein